MLKLKKLKEQKQREQEAGANGQGQTSAAIMRMTRDLHELELPKTVSINIPDKKDIMNFEICIQPDEGYYKGAVFPFQFTVNHEYPHEPPKVKCKKKLYHPNIDLQGNVCLNILRDDWKPVLSINSIVHGLSFLFDDPNPDDPLNKDAAEMLATNPNQFERNVRMALQGGRIGNETYDLCYPAQSPYYNRYGSRGYY